MCPQPSGKVSLDRIRKMVSDFSTLGMTDTVPSSISRLAYTEPDLKAKKRFIEYVRALELQPVVDKIGNVYGLPFPLSKSDLIILTGSHLDTVVRGGRYDGTVGIVCALEAARILQEERYDLEHKIGVVNFACEEAARFKVATLGSRFMTGKTTFRDLSKIKDTTQEKNSLAELVRGIEFEALTEPRTGSLLELPLDEVKLVGCADGFIEVHIEQGYYLEKKKVSLGIVTHIAAPTRLQITLKGTVGHSGTTPMSERTDLLLACFQIWKEFDEYCTNLRSEKLVWTMIGIDTPSSQWGMIPGDVVLNVEIRSSENRAKDECVKALRRIVRRICREKGINSRSAVEEVYKGKPVKLSKRVCSCVKKACDKVGLESMEMISGAGHDAMNMTDVMETGMIFIPCRKGISHNPSEFTSAENIAKGVRVLVDTIREMDRLLLRSKKVKKFDMAQIPLL